MSRGSRAWVVWPLVAFAVHAVSPLGYGWFRDELYYVACARRLAWGYVDHPPLSIALLRGVLALAGTSLLAMRLAAAALAALTVLAVGLMTRELGGGERARTVAMLATLCAPVILALDSYYSMNAFDLLAWAVATILFLRALRARTRGAWCGFGLAIGLGLLNKLSVLWLGGGFGVGLLLTARRAELRRAEPWLAGGLALAVAAPHLLWQALQGFPTIEFMRNASSEKMRATTALEFAASQVMTLGPACVLLAALGLGACFRRRPDGRALVLGIAWLAIFGLLAANGTSRSYYLTPACLWLFAMGGVALEERAARAFPLYPAAITALVAFGVVCAPLAMPILPTETYIRYARALGVEPSTEERQTLGPLPQFFADMHGWEDFAASVERAADQLPAERRAHAAFFGSNYGEAAAVEVLGGDRAAFSGHNSYWLWGPPDETIDAVVVATYDDARLRELFDHVAKAGTTSCGPYCMPDENDVPLYAAWGHRIPWGTLWPSLRHYD